MSSRLGMRRPPSRARAAPQSLAQLGPLVVGDRVVGRVADARSPASACACGRRPRSWRRAPRAPSRERALRASVLNSTRMHPSSSKARPSISSFASRFAPVRQAEGWSQVQPISSPCWSGRMVRYELLPIGSPVASEMVANGHSAWLSPAPTRVSNQRSKASGSPGILRSIQVQISGSEAAARRPSRCSRPSGSSRTMVPSSARAGGGQIMSQAPQQRRGSASLRSASRASSRKRSKR